MRLLRPKSTKLDRARALLTVLMIIGSARDIFRGVRIVAVILCTTGIALLAYMDGVDPKEGVRIEL